MAFTQEQLNTVPQQSPASTLPFDPNGFSMQTLTPPEQKPNLISRAVGAVKNQYAGNLTNAGDNIANKYMEEGKNVIEDTKRLVTGSNSTSNENGFNLAEKTANRLVAGTHVAGDFASAIFTPLIEGLKSAVPKSLSQGASKVGSNASEEAKYLIDKIPGATDLLNHISGSWNSLDEDTKRVVAKDIPNILTVLGASKVSALNPEIPSPSKLLSNLKGDLFGTVSSNASFATPELAKVNINNSGGINVQDSINSGDVPKESVFQGNSNKVTREFAQGRLDDVAQKLDIYKKGLGDELRKSVDLDNLTLTKGDVPEDLITKANQLIDDNPTKGGLAGTVKNVKNKITDLFSSSDDVSGSTNITDNIIDNPLTKKEQLAAFKEGRASVDNGEISYNDSKKAQNIKKAIKPLVDEGKLVDPKTPEDHVSNFDTVKKEVMTQDSINRSALKDSNATWNSNELKGNLNDVDIPDPVKNEPTMIRNAESLKNAAVKIADDAARTPDGILDLRKNFDSYIKDNYGDKFFSQGRNADPFHKYVFSLRDTMNDMAAYKLPDGLLPDGTPYRDALIKQSNLINAQEEMAKNFVRSFPEASTNVSRFMKSHPMIHKISHGAIQSIVKTALGIGIATAAIRKLQQGK